MMPRPGDGCDLDALVAEALASGNVDRVLDDFYSSSLLVAAVAQHRLDLADTLLAAGAAMTADDLAWVIEWHVGAKTVRFLRVRGVPCNAYCLYTAAQRPDWTAVSVLLDHGAYVQEPLLLRTGYIPTGLQEKVTITLLHMAAWQASVEVIEDLLARGAAIDARDSEGMTPLMKACHLKPHRQKVNGASVRTLLRHGAAPNARTPLGETPLLLCLGERLPDQNQGHRRKVALALLDGGADPNVISPAGTTPLMFAARDNDVELMRALLRAGARADAGTPDGRNALDIAQKYESEDAVKFLRSGDGAAERPSRLRRNIRSRRIR